MTYIAKHAVRHWLIASALVTATAALLPSTAAAVGAATLVDTRSEDALARDIGRAGGDPYWASQPVTPLPEVVVKAYDKTKEGVVKAYEKTKAVLTTPPASTGPERYGRAG